MNNISKVITGFLVCLCVCILARPTNGVTVDQYGHAAFPIDNNLRDISATGTQLLLGDDDTAVDIPIGFDFQFYGNIYSTVSIRSNGYMGFTPGYTGVNHGWTENILGTDSPNNCIYGCLLDLNPSASGTIYYETRGIEPARTFIVGFYAVEEYDDPASLFTFEMILHESTSAIELQYGNCPVGSEAKTVGIDNIDGSDYLPLARAEWLDFSNQAYLIRAAVARNPNPPDNAEMVEVTATLSWDDPRDFTPLGYYVYFGTDPNVDHYPPVINGLLVNSYDPDLATDEDYYWRVDPVDPNDGSPVIITGPVWTFSTETSAPYFLVQPANQYVNELEDAEFNVEVTTTGGPATFQWYKVDTGLITHDGVKYSIVSDDSTSQLTIHDCTDSDEGLYYCTATNDAGSTNSQNAGITLKKLLAYWPFEGNADEATGNITTTVVEGKVDYIDGPGTAGQAIDLDLRDYVVLASNTELVYGSDKDFSVSLWIKTAGWDGDPSIISNKDWGDGGNPGWVIAANDYNTWEWNYSDGDGSRADADPRDEFFPPENLKDGNWHHIVVTYDRDGQARFYHDGALVPTNEGEGIDISAFGSIDTEYPTVLAQDGTEDYSWGYDLAAAFDEVCFYNYVLTSDEVSDIYTQITGEYVCTDPPEYDLTEDCVVNLDDLAVFVLDWQGCGLFPASYCP
ncbi:MAG: immunoglobulin domain-containing protein [Planctomycetota bacterium]|nr:MAG: immunoglobulin domain-containing protein [Planctomycetota bacterium]